jgi:hypothetical protein
MRRLALALIFSALGLSGALNLAKLKPAIRSLLEQPLPAS